MSYPTRVVCLTADQHGHFRAVCNFNGHKLHALVDTGATSVALNPALAKSLGLRMESRCQALTAGGPVESWASTIDKIALGGMVRHRVKAIIIPGMDDEILLGMSFLSTFILNQENGYMIIREEGHHDLMNYALSHGMISLLSVLSSGIIATKLTESYPQLGTALSAVSAWAAAHTLLPNWPPGWELAMAALLLGSGWGASFFMVFRNVDGGGKNVKAF